MSEDSDFKPRLGKIRAKGRGSFRGQILQAIRRAGGLKSTSGMHGKGTRLGRGRGIAAGRRTDGRRVVVKARFTRLAGRGMGAARAHLRYLQRDGVTREGQPGAPYDREADHADGRAFLDRAEGDRHQFRFIIAPEDGDQYDDLKGVTRRLMAQMEMDLGTKLDWVAVDHFNTGHPHTHIVVRGRDDQGQDLVIARRYISQGLRERAEALVTLDLGPPSEHEISDTLRREIDQPRFTRLDRQLLRDADPEGHVGAHHHDPFQQSLRAGRLKTLQVFGLAEDMGEGQWRLSPALEITLRDMGEKGDIIKSLSYGLGNAVDIRHAVLHLGPERAGGPPIVGEVVRRGPLDDFGDRSFLAVDAMDGRVHVFDTGKTADGDGPAERTIVRITPMVPALKPADHTIIDVAARNGGFYDVEAHLRLEASATETFAQTHVRRLEAIRRTVGGVERNTEGGFFIPANYADIALSYEQQLARQQPVRIDRLSNRRLEHLPTYDGPTWLDRTDVSPVAVGTGLPKRVGQALVARAAWLNGEGIGTFTEGRQVLSSSDRDRLMRRELERLALGETRVSNKPYAAVQKGERVEGVLRGFTDTAESRMAVIERARDFTLVPWRPVLEPHIGKQISGVLEGGAINWTIGRSKGRSVE